MVEDQKKVTETWEQAWKNRARSFLAEKDSRTSLDEVCISLCRMMNTRMWKVHCIWEEHQFRCFLGDALKAKRYRSVSRSSSIETSRRSLQS